MQNNLKVKGPEEVAAKMERWADTTVGNVNLGLINPSPPSPLNFSRNNAIRIVWKETKMWRWKRTYFADCERFGRAENLKLYFHGKNHWYYLQDRMFVDNSLEKLFRGFIFDEMYIKLISTCFRGLRNFEIRSNQGFCFETVLRQ